MKLSIANLKKVGAFTGAPVEKEISWKTNKGQTQTATVYVRPLSYDSAISDIDSATKKGDPIAGRIAACICDEKGKKVFTPDDITGDADRKTNAKLPPDKQIPERGPLDGNLTMALLTVIGEVNGLGKPEN